MDKDYLFIYGTLLLKEELNISKFLYDSSEFIGNACLHDKLYEIDNYPGLILSEDKKDKVYGKVFRLKNFDKTIALLNEYEEVGPQFAYPNEYVLKKVEVCMQGTKYYCWVYIYNHPVQEEKRILSGDYLIYKIKKE